MTLFACTADGATYALGWLPVDDPARMGDVLGALRDAAAANLDSAQAQHAPFSFSGVTPNPAAGHWQLAGKGQGGGALAAQVAVFAVGAVAYQATIIGAGPDSEPARVFLASIRLAR